MSYSLGESYLSSPDQPSSVYPDRLIRPLPKRSLRSRLSEETAETISYPPTVPSTELPAYNQYGENGDYINDRKVLVHQNGDIFDGAHDHYHDDDHDHCPHHHHHHHCHHDDDDEFDSGEDSNPVAVRRANAYRSSPRSPRSLRHTRYSSSGSKMSPSGPEGYDAFENTNNKKKRKIPTSGSLSMHPASLSADLAHLGLGGLKDEADDGSEVSQYYGTGNLAVSAGLGVQGAGRGRNSRRLSGRNPLGVSVNGSNARSAPARYDGNVSSSLKDDNTKAEQGIISTAIANATALLRKPAENGQENGGVLDQQAKPAPTNSQFTFTCEADLKGVTFPEQRVYAAGYPQRVTQPPDPTSGVNSKFATQGTQTSPNVQSQHQNGQHAPASAQNASTPNAQGKKPRRRRGDVYVLAARQRRLQQEYSNLHHPPATEDIWICEFCEYESIFGVQPQALIRQYEIKDRKERRRLAEKRRLLEKAKLKGRKGKKQSKNAAAKAANNATHQPANQAYDQPLDQLGDDYLDDGYDDDPIPMPAPPQAPVKQPMPGSFDNSGEGKGGTDRGGGTR